MTTTDIFPTILSVINIKPAGLVKPIDGIDLTPILKGKKRRDAPICFQFNNQFGVITDQYKLYSPNRGNTYELYDLLADKDEKNNLGQEKKEMIDNLKKALTEWLQSCKQSDAGKDYD